MLRIFFDTEFTALSEDATLISIGFVDEIGERSFYAELSDTWRLSDAGEFAKNAHQKAQIMFFQTKPLGSRCSLRCEVHDMGNPHPEGKDFN